MPNFSKYGKSKQFYNFLRESIVNGYYDCGERFPSIRQLAEQYEISIPTVSLVVSNLVNDGFLRIERGKGAYVARTTENEGNSTKIIGVVLDNYMSDFNVQPLIFSSILDYMQKRGILVLPFKFNDLEKAIHLGLDGIIIFPPPSEEYDPKQVASVIGSLPAVCINRDIEELNRDMVRVDFLEGSRMATEYLLEQGRKKIILFRHPSPTIGKQFMQGYMQAHEKYGVIPDEKLIGLHTGEIIGKLKIADGLIHTDVKIHTFRDTFKEQGISLPKDMGIVGINNSSYARMMSPRLTALAFSGEDIGKTAAKLLTERIVEPGKEKEEIIIPTNLVVRAT